MPRKKNTRKKKLTTTRNKVIIRKPNRYNLFQRALSEHLKTKDVKPSDKFHVVAKKIYSKLDPDVPAKSFPDYVESMYNKFYRESSSYILPSGIRKEFPFYLASEVFSNSDYETLMLRIFFTDEVEGVGETWDETFNEVLDFTGWFSGRPKYYLRNNYNNSPTARFVLIDYTDTMLTYQIQVQESAVLNDSYDYESGEFVKRDKSVLDTEARAQGFKDAKSKKQSKGVKKDEELMKKAIELESLKKEREKLRLETIKELRKAKFSKEEIMEILKELNKSGK